MYNISIKQPTAVAVLVITALLIGCGSKQKQNQKKNESTDTVTSRPEASPALPPNSAHVTGTIESIRSSDSGTISMTFKIKRISGYGSATRPLSKNEQLTLSTTPAFLKQKNKQLSTDDSLNIVISQTITMNEQNQSTWRIVDFK